MKLTKPQQKKLVSVLITLVVLLLGNYFIESPQIDSITKGSVDPGFYRVIEVSDGDTIVVDMNSTEERIRMIGVDTPEKNHPSKPVQCFAEAASKFTKNLIGDQAVRLEADPTNSNRDRYDRLLRYVYLPDNRLVNAEIIKSGYGFAYTNFLFEKKEDFKNYQRDAEQNNLGLWGKCDVFENKYGSPESPATD